MKSLFFRLTKGINTTRFALLMSTLNLVFFHFAFFRYVLDNIDPKSLNGIFLLTSILILVVVANAFAFYLFLSLSRWVGKVLLVLTFVISSVCTYFVNTYNAIIDRGMVGNFFNTNYDEASSFFSIKLIAYLLVFGILPAIFIIRTPIVREKVRRTLITLGAAVLFIVAMVFANATNWLWIDKNATTLGALVMPWSYTVNTARYFSHKHKINEKEILLPDAVITNDRKAVVVLVIGESARSENFSLYGYPKNTNPLLAQTPNLHHFPASSCATYTTAALKCILEHEHTSELYEILPNYLYRNGVDVVWRTTNWGEPPVHIRDYQTKDDLEKIYSGENAQYDEILLTGLKERILAAQGDKLLVVLHTSTSHGPTYSKKYPPRFETFAPVCNSVELSNCSNEELMNAYDNTIVYTDYLLHSVIEILKETPEFDASMIYLSDHGESLGEKNLYMHGVPMGIAPKEQYQIPFIVWTSDSTRGLKPNTELSQANVFHSVMAFLGLDSPIFNEDLNIYK